MGEGGPMQRGPDEGAADKESFKPKKISEVKGSLRSASDALGLGRDTKINLRNSGTLADIAPTLLELMQLNQPDSMTGKSLIIKNSRVY